MSHFDFVRPGKPGNPGQETTSVWPQECVPGASDLQRFDVKQSKIVNATNGGTWNPTSPIVIGGLGIRLPTAGSVISGGVRTQTGGTIVLGNSDNIALSPLRTRTLTLDLLDAVQASYGGWGGASAFVPQFPGATNQSLPLTPPLPTPMGVLPTSYEQLLIQIPSRFLHHLAGQITSVTLNYRMTATPNYSSLGLGIPYNSFLPFVSMVGFDYRNIPAFNCIPPIGTFSSTLATQFHSTWKWLPGTPVALNSYISYNALGKVSTGIPTYFRCSQAGTTGGVEPFWNATPNATTIDNTAHWVSVGPTGLAAQIGAVNAPQSITAAYDTNLPPADGSNFLDNTQYTYVVQLGLSASSFCPIAVQPENDWYGGLAIAPIPFPILIHSLQFTFGAIASTPPFE